MRCVFTGPGAEIVYLGVLRLAGREVECQTARQVNQNYTRRQTDRQIDKISTDRQAGTEIALPMERQKPETTRQTDIKREKHIEDEVA